MNTETITKHTILRERIESAARIHQHERAQAAQSQTIWRDYGAQTTDYAKTFPDFLRQGHVETFEQWLPQLKQQNQWQRLYVLDVAAPLSSFIGKHDLIDGGIAITLTDTRSPAQKTTDTVRNQELIEGNVLQRQAWRKAETAMAQLGIEAFNVILCRPFAGIVDQVDAEIHARLYFNILGRMYKKMSPNGSVCLTEVPDSPENDRLLPRYVQRLHAHHITAQLQRPDPTRQYGYRYALMLKRTEQSPDELPKPI